MKRVFVVAATVALSACESGPRWPNIDKIVCDCMMAENYWRPTQTIRNVFTKCQRVGTDSLNAWEARQ
jgi:hypothetical protein